MSVLLTFRRGSFVNKIFRLWFGFLGRFRGLQTRTLFRAYRSLPVIRNIRFSTFNVWGSLICPLEILWMDEILHHVETMGSHCSLVFTGESSFQGLLERCRILSIHSITQRESSVEPVRPVTQVCPMCRGLGRCCGALSRSHWASLDSGRVFVWGTPIMVVSLLASP